MPREGGAHHVARVQGQHRHSLLVQPGAQGVSKEDVAELGMVVGPHVTVLVGWGRQGVQVQSLFCQT